MLTSIIILILQLKQLPRHMVEIKNLENKIKILTKDYNTLVHKIKTTILNNKNSINSYKSQKLSPVKKNNNPDDNIIIKEEKVHNNDNRNKDSVQIMDVLENGDLEKPLQSVNMSEGVSELVSKFVIIYGFVFVFICDSFKIVINLFRNCT